MKRSNKWIQDKKLRRFISKILDYNKKHRSWGSKNKNPEYSLMRFGWKVQYELSKEIKKHPIGEYLQSILYLIVEQKHIIDLKDAEADFNPITKDEYDKLTPGQKLCFVAERKLESVEVQGFLPVPVYTKKYILDPELHKHIVPVIFKHFTRNYISRHTEDDEKAKRDDLWGKATKVMGWRRHDMDWKLDGQRKRRKDKFKQDSEEIKDLL